LITQLPVNGSFYISLDEPDIVHLGRSSKLQTSADGCSRGLMVFLYHGSKGTETIIGEQFIPLYKLLSKKMKTKLSKSVPIEKIFLQSDSHPQHHSSRGGNGDTTVGENGTTVEHLLPGESYSMESEIDIIQSLKLTFISASLYQLRSLEEETDDQGSQPGRGGGGGRRGSGGEGIQTESISQSVNLAAHLVTWNGKEIPLPFLWDNSLPAPIRGREYVFTSSHGIMYADFVRITFTDCLTRAIIGLAFIPIKDFTQIHGGGGGGGGGGPVETHSSLSYSIVDATQFSFDEETSLNDGLGFVPSSGQPIPFFFQNLHCCPNSYPEPPVVGHVTVNLYRIHESIITSQSQSIQFTCHAVLTNENTTKWPGYALSPDAIAGQTTIWPWRIR
jgi:hypothetical protein